MTRTERRFRRLPVAFQRRSQRIDQLLQMVPPAELPLEVWDDLCHARTIVALTPAEFARYALASATLLRMAERRAVRP